MVRIDTYTQYFTITSANFSKLIYLLYDFNKKLITYKKTVKIENNRPKVIMEADKHFYIIETAEEEYDIRKNVIRYPISLLDKIIKYLEYKNIDKDTIEIEYHDPISYRKINISIDYKLKPRDYQTVYIDRIIKLDRNNILVDLDTGYGKTFIAMSALTKIAHVFSVIVLPRYIDKWIGDVLKLTDIMENEILVIKGGSMILDILNNKIDVSQYQCFIISLITLSNFIKSYLHGMLADKTDKTPEDLFKILKTDIVLNDETHQEFANIYKINLFTNIKLFLGLTATLTTKDKRINVMYHILFPSENRISNIVEHVPYVYVHSVRYRFRNRRQIKYKNNFGYNQAKLEKSIMKYTNTLTNYLKFITGLLSNFYIKKRKEGDKAIVFMYTIDLCNLTADYVSKIFKDIKVNKYTQEDNYDTIESSDIIITTLGSAGTALDIPNLVTVIQTVNVDSITANLQSLGRLRNIKDKKMDFVYIWSNDIPSHRRYNINRLRLFTKKAKHIRSIEYRSLI